MSRGFGIGPTTAREQLQKTWPAHVGVQPLPSGWREAWTVRGWWDAE